MITIADIQMKHIRGFHTVLDAVSTEKKYLAWTEAPLLRELKAFVANSIAKGNPQIVALADGKVVGWCDITPHSRPTTKHCGSLGMGLVHDHRHKGIGTKLIHSALQRAKTFGLYRVELEVFEENSTAIHLYKKVGFKEEGRKVCAVKIDDHCIDALVMALLLKDYPVIQEN